LAVLAPSLAEAMRTIREKTIVIPDGTLLPWREDVRRPILAVDATPTS
jgi:hypothetical protein